MRAGKIVAIYTAPARGAEVRSHREIEARAGHGLVGDRHAGKRGRGRSLSLVALEAVDTLVTQHGITMDPGDTRRNLVTEGVDLADLVGRRFHVGEVEVEGLEPCHACANLELLETVPGLKDSPAGHGGLLAEIITDGRIRVDDPIAVDP